MSVTKQELQNLVLAWGIVPKQELYELTYAELRQHYLKIIERCGHEHSK